MLLPRQVVSPSAPWPVSKLLDQVALPRSLERVSCLQPTMLQPQLHLVPPAALLRLAGAILPQLLAQEQVLQLSEVQHLLLLLVVAQQHLHLV